MLLPILVHRPWAVLDIGLVGPPLNDAGRGLPGSKALTQAP